MAELDRRIKHLLESATGQLRVRGEIGSLHRAGSGHAYFSLKDEREDALIECVMYRSAPARARQQLAEGEQVVLCGRVTVYPPRGRMQLIAEDVLDTAHGALLAELERLKQALAAEGLFDPARHKPLPKAPRTIAVLTSRDGAAIHDVVRVASRRGRVRIILVPTPVQGATAAAAIAKAIALTDRLADIDVMIITRGGGSMEDLAAYSDERVVRAIAAARLPVVSAVGHEIDTTLADLAADARAATPSQAAELVVADDAERRATLEHLWQRLGRATRHRLSRNRTELLELRRGLGEPRRRLLEQSQRIDELGVRLERSMRRTVSQRRAAVGALQQRMQARHPRQVVAHARVRLGPLSPRLDAAMRRQLQQARTELATRGARLTALSPLGVLARGYAIATDATGAVLTDAAAIGVGETLKVRLHQGSVRGRVERCEPPSAPAGHGDEPD